MCVHCKVYVHNTRDGNYMQIVVIIVHKSNFSVAGPSVDRFGFNTLPDLQECYSSCILESDLTHISIFFYEKK